MSTPAETVDADGAVTPNRFLDRLTLLLQRRWKTLVLIIPFAWLLIFFLAPFFFVLKISFAEYALKSPPYTDLFEWADEGIM